MNSAQPVLMRQA